MEGFRQTREDAAVKYIATIEAAGSSTDHVVDVDRASEVTIDGATHQVDLRSIDGEHLYSLILDDRSYEMHVERDKGAFFVQIGGDRYKVDVEQERLKQLRAMGGRQHEEHGNTTVPAPMPGLVVRVFVEAGQPVEVGQPLVILEAMKMENEIRSPRSGVVRDLLTTAGAAVNKDDDLLIIAPHPEGAEASGAAPGTPEGRRAAAGDAGSA